jgi:hypothetical protein
MHGDLQNVVKDTNQVIRYTEYFDWNHVTFRAGERTIPTSTFEVNGRLYELYQPNDNRGVDVPGVILVRPVQNEDDCDEGNWFSQELLLEMIEAAARAEA